jgi:hypothetical protein
MKRHSNHQYKIIVLLLASIALPLTGKAEDRGDGNTSDGASALSSLTSGIFNTAIGSDALESTQDGARNTGVGANVLLQNIHGSDNTAVGNSALHNNITNQNTAVGAEALSSNFSGSSNSALGNRALTANVGSSYNTAIGFEALQSSDANDNTALGALSLQSDTSGYYNTASGVSALFSNTSGYYNTASGVSALFFNVVGHDNTATGYQALVHTKGNSNLGIGSNAGANLTTGSNNIDVGANVLGQAGEANTIRIGKQGTQQKTLIAGIYGKTVASGVGVIVGTTGQLGTVLSSAQFKQQIKPMDKASESILALKPVTFRYKEELDPDAIPQFGLIAEEVEEVNPDLVARDNDGKVMTVRYDAVNAMLLNEFLKEHRKVEEQRAYFESKLAEQQKQIEALTAGLQKVTAHLESRERDQRVASNQ